MILDWSKTTLFVHTVTHTCDRVMFNFHTIKGTGYKERRKKTRLLIFSVLLLGFAISLEFLGNGRLQNCLSVQSKLQIKNSPKFHLTATNQFFLFKSKSILVIDHRHGSVQVIDYQFLPNLYPSCRQLSTSWTPALALKTVEWDFLVT